MATMMTEYMHHSRMSSTRPTVKSGLRCMSGMEIRPNTSESDASLLLLLLRLLLLLLLASVSEDEELPPGRVAVTPVGGIVLIRPGVGVAGRGVDSLGVVG